MWRHPFNILVNYPIINPPYCNSSEHRDVDSEGSAVEMINHLLSRSSKQSLSTWNLKDIIHQGKTLYHENDILSLPWRTYFIFGMNIHLYLKNELFKFWRSMVTVTSQNFWPILEYANYVKWQQQQHVTDVYSKVTTFSIHNIRGLLCTIDTFPVRMFLNVLTSTNIFNITIHN